MEHSKSSEDDDLKEIGQLKIKQLENLHDYISENLFMSIDRNTLNLLSTFFSRLEIIFILKSPAENVPRKPGNINCIKPTGDVEVNLVTIAQFLE